MLDTSTHSNWPNTKEKKNRRRKQEIVIQFFFFPIFTSSYGTHLPSPAPPFMCSMKIRCNLKQTKNWKKRKEKEKNNRYQMKILEATDVTYWLILHLFFSLVVTVGYCKTYLPIWASVYLAPTESCAFSQGLMLPFKKNLIFVLHIFHCFNR